jgi:hypothetical protein
MYLVFLTKGIIVTYEQSQGRDASVALSKEDYQNIFSAWYFGQELQDETFQDMIASFIVKRLHDSAMYDEDVSPFLESIKTPLVVQWIWKNDNTEPLKRLIVDAVTRFRTMDDVEDFVDPDRYPTHFIGRLYQAEAKARNLIETKSGPYPSEKVKVEPSGAVFGKNECIYHLHEVWGGQCWTAT